MVGIYWFLKIIPIWALTVFLFFVCLNVLFILRDKLEGLPYNISVCSQQGDTALIISILIAVERLQKGIILPNWAQPLAFQFLCLGIAASAGIIDTTVVTIFGDSWHEQTIADRYHNLFALPLLVFFILASLPILLKEQWWEIMITIFLFGVWVSAFLFDSL